MLDLSFFFFVVIFLIFVIFFVSIFFNLRMLYLYVFILFVRFIFKICLVCFVEVFFCLFFLFCKVIKNDKIKCIYQLFFEGFFRIDNLEDFVWFFVVQFIISIVKEKVFLFIIRLGGWFFWVLKVIFKFGCYLFVLIRWFFNMFL